MPAPTPSAHLRTALGLFVAVLSVVLVLPEWLTPLARWFTEASGGAVDVLGWLQTARHVVAAMGLSTSWPILPGVVSLGLFLACWLIPAEVDTGRKSRAVIRDETTIAVGALLLAEPLMHLGFLAWSGWHPSAMSRDAVLPVPFQAVTAGAGGWWEGLLTILTYSLIVPLAEELFFRGRLLDLIRTRLGGTRMATVSAVSLTTLTFAAAHGTPVQALFALPLGLLLALMRLRGVGLGACVLAHACHNALFLFIGPVLFAQSWAAPLLAFTGAMMIAAAWIDHPRTSPQPRVPNRWRLPIAIAAVLITAGVLTLTWPFYRQVQDRLWAAAAHRVVVTWRVDNDLLLRRLEYQEQRGRMEPARRDGLYDLLVREPCQRLPGGNPRQAQVLAQLDPARFAGEVREEAIYDALIDLADCRARWERLASAARTLATRSTRDLALVATSHPEALLQWYQLPERQLECVTLLQATFGHDRRRLLAALEHAQPGQIADVLLALPVEFITPLDRRHLRLHYADADARLAELAVHDPARARAFSGEDH